MPEKVECPRCNKPTTVGGGICTCCGELLPAWVIAELTR